MPALTARTALITGASTGIGYELSNLFATDGCNLVLVARHEQRLQTLAEELRQKHGVSVVCIAKDLSREPAVREVFDELQHKGIVIDFLVNNAGYGAYGKFAETDLRTEMEMVTVNALALTNLTKLFLHGMLQRNYGRILNVGSTASFQPGPLMAVYAATKAYVLSFSEALSHELQGTNVTASVLCPGPTRTEFQKRAVMDESKLFRRFVMDAPSVAVAGYRGMMKGKRLIIPGAYNKFLIFTVRLSPRQFVLKVVRNMLEKRKPQ